MKCSKLYSKSLHIKFDISFRVFMQVDRKAKEGKRGRVRRKGIERSQGRGGK